MRSGQSQSLVLPYGMQALKLCQNARAALLRSLANGSSFGLAGCWVCFGLAEWSLASDRKWSDLFHCTFVLIARFPDATAPSLSH